MKLLGGIFAGVGGTLLVYPALFYGVTALFLFAGFLDNKEFVFVCVTLIGILPMIPYAIVEFLWEDSSAWLVVPIGLMQLLIAGGLLFGAVDPTHPSLYHADLRGDAALFVWLWPAICLKPGFWGAWMCGAVLGSSLREATSTR